MATRIPALIQLSDPRVAAQLVLTMINTGIGQRYNSDTSGCLLHGIKRLSQIKYPMCQRSQISVLYPSQLRDNSSSNCCKPTHSNRQQSIDAPDSQ